MPELPEVETTCRGIAPHVTGQTIAHIIIRNWQMRFPVPASLKLSAEGQCIISVNRRGKYLLLTTEVGHIIIHLGMSGVLQITSPKIKLKKHDHVDIVLRNNKILRFNDPRRFGCILWHEGACEQHRLLAHLAPEPLSDAFDSHYLLTQLKGKKTAIKIAIMNSRIVVGVGNIYASEALFLGRIHPLTPAGKLSKTQVNQLVESIKTILKKAIDAGGTTLRDFINSDGKPGYFAQNLAVYGRKNLSCVHCHNPIAHLKIAKRASFFCPICQIAPK